MENEFRNFCADQLERLGGAFPKFGLYSSATKTELVSWMESKAHGNRERVVALITEVSEFDNLPTLADLNRIWLRMFPVSFRQPNRDCGECHGFGFKITLRRFDISGASRCPNACPVPTGGEGGSAAPFNYSAERQRPQPKKPVAGNIRMSDVNRAVQAMR
jgi:hypothetical protein